MARPVAASPFAPDPLAEHNRLLGERGESIAARHLAALGMVVLDRNWRCDAGEIDLVLRDGTVLVICEVKTRTSTDYGDPLEAVDQRKADRLRRLGARWLRVHDCHPDDVRVDLVGVLVPAGRPVEVEHVEGDRLMAFATARSLALKGADGHVIDVQVDVSPGLVNTTIVGRVDKSLSEARDRVRMAINNDCGRWPATKRVTILLAPADLPKGGTHYDLAIAIAVLAADKKHEELTPDLLEGWAFIGELSVSGALRPVPGVLPMVIAAAAHGITRVFVPEPQAVEAALVPGMTVFGVRSLAQVSAVLRDVEVPEAAPVVGPSASPLATWRGDDRLADLDLRDLDGLEDVRYAVEVAAAGGHPLMLIGPRGTGKTSIAERIPTILPDLSTEQSLEVTALHSVAGTLPQGSGLLRRPPWFAPHHSATAASVLGGGTGRVRPGQVSLAHHGVLFLDEFPHFRSDVIEAMRQPLESGEVTIARGEESATFPARSLVVLAANPCPCGNFHGLSGGSCECTEVQRTHYRRKLSGPILDRVDIWMEVRPQGRRGGSWGAEPESSDDVRARVVEARRRQARRYLDCSWQLNAACPGPVLAERWPLDPEGQRQVDQELSAGRLSRRGLTRVQRLAWTVADCAGVARPGPREADIALALRSDDPARSLPARVVSVAAS